MCLIYILKNKINLKLYVGQTTQNLKKRLKSHIKRKFLIGNAIKKYDIENFEIYKFYVPENLLDYFEKEMIKRLKTLYPLGYNLDTGGNKQKHRHIKTRNKISETLKGKYIDNKNSWSGKHHTKDSKEKISISQKKLYKNGYINPRKNKKLSEETKVKLSKTMTGKYDKENNPFYGKKHKKYSLEKISKNHSDVSGHKNPRAKSVYCIELNKIWKCAKYAAKELLICYNSIPACCRGRYKTAGGYHWKYV